MRTPRRLAALGLVALGLGLAAVADANPVPLEGGSGAGASSALANAVSVNGAASSAWYCSGPLPVGARPVTSSLVIANLGSKRLTGTVSVALSTGGTRDAAVSVPADGSRVVQLPSTGRPGYAAATVEMDGAGLGVEELTTGPGTVASSRCVSSLGRRTYFPAGSTLGGRNLALALYDPSATPAVASVSFAIGAGGTSTGQAAPAAFQQVPVAAGQVVVLDVGRQVPERGLVATTVSVSGGHLVAGVLATVPESARSLTMALVHGSSRRAGRWMFAAAPRGATPAASFSVLDPGSRATTARIVIGSGSTRASVAVPLGAGGAATVPFAAAVVAGRSATVTASGGVKIVVARTTVVARAQAPRSAVVRRVPASAKKADVLARAKEAAAAGARTAEEVQAVTVIPALGAGTSTTPGVTEARRRWLLAGGASSSTLGEVVTVTNPGGSPTAFRLLRLANAGTVVMASGGSSGAVSQPGGSSGAVPPLAIPAEHVATLRVPAGGSVTIDVDYLLGEPGPLSLVVAADRPVIASELLYARGSRRSSGFVSVGGIPVG